MPDAPIAQVDLSAVAHNLERLRTRLTSGAGVLAAVKADGYGHGAVPVARALEARGVGWFGVATAAEAFELRAGGVGGQILIFGPVRERLAELAEAGVSVTVADRGDLDAIRAAAPATPLAVHLKLDTGMGRLGRPWTDAETLAAAIDTTPGAELAAVWTHFAKSDEPADPDTWPDQGDFTRCQIEAFELALDTLGRAGLRPPLTHAANSAGIVAYPESHYDLVRPGIALYGYHSSPQIEALEPELQPAMTLTAPVTFVKRVPAGTPISYGAGWQAPHETTVATVRFGYADGYPRRLSGHADATLHGQRVSVAGRVCMDQLMLDAGDLDVAPGDRAVLFGPQGPTAEELAQRIGTISYELLVRVGSRVERSYREG